MDKEQTLGDFISHPGMPLLRTHLRELLLGVLTQVLDPAGDDRARQFLIGQYLALVNAYFLPENLLNESKGREALDVDPLAPLLEGEPSWLLRLVTQQPEAQKKSSEETPLKAQHVAVAWPESGISPSEQVVP